MVKTESKSSAKKTKSQGRHSNGSSLNCGIALFPKSAQLFGIRTAVRLKTRDYFGSLEDSEKALDLMLPEVDANKATRAAIRCRRAMALQCLERNVDALIELEIAGKLLPKKEEKKSRKNKKGDKEAKEEKPVYKDKEGNTVFHSDGRPMEIGPNGEAQAPPPHLCAPIT